jgi:hypothetical protein
MQPELNIQTRIAKISILTSWPGSQSSQTGTGAAIIQIQTPAKALWNEIPDV